MQEESIDFVVSPGTPDPQTLKQKSSAPSVSSTTEKEEKGQSRPVSKNSDPGSNNASSSASKTAKKSSKVNVWEQPPALNSQSEKTKSVPSKFAPPTQSKTKPLKKRSSQLRSPSKSSSKHPPKTSKVSLPPSNKANMWSRSLFCRPWLGLKNSGSNCYANAMLNCLYPFPELWDFSSQVPLHQALKVMFIAMNTKPRDPSKATPLDPKRFLEALARHISSTQTGFVYQRQHDAAEILGYVLDNLISSGLDKKRVCYSLFTSYHCQNCGSTRPAHTNEVSEQILDLVVQESIVKALITRLSGDLVIVYCDSCKSNQQCVEQTAFSELPDVFVMRLRRDQVEGRLGQEVRCDRKLSIGPEDVDAPMVKYHLVAVVHHIGRSLSSGHYTTTLISPHSKQMWNFNDEVVKEVRKLNQETAYVLLYRREK